MALALKLSDELGAVEVLTHSLQVLFLFEGGVCVYHHEFEVFMADFSVQKVLYLVQNRCESIIVFDYFVPTKRLFQLLDRDVAHLFVI